MEIGLLDMAKPLLNWYRENHRTLPWRTDPEPYYVWVSEIMLQQTRVEAVIPYFQKFIKKYATIAALAKAEEETLLKLWQGLGYYNRVKNMQKAARILTEHYGGVLPQEEDEIKKLPGIGDYTAGAILSIAYKKPVPAVDGNVLRVFSRLLAIEEDVREKAIKESISSSIRELLLSFKKEEQEGENPCGDLNQAWMELGATVCLPNGMPKCDLCPLSFCCKALKENRQGELPVKKSKKERPIEEKTVFLFLSEGKVAIQKRAEKGLLAGLWEFPNKEGYLDIACLQDTLREFDLRLQGDSILELGETKHIFTHREWHMKGFLLKVDRFSKKDGFLWVTKQELRERYSVPSAFQYFLNLLFQTGLS